MVGNIYHLSLVFENNIYHLSLASEDTLYFTILSIEVINTSMQMRLNDFRCKGFLGYFASTSAKIKHFKELFKSATSNLGVSDKILVCISHRFNFASGHFPKYLCVLILPKGARTREIAKFYPGENLST